MKTTANVLKTILQPLCGGKGTTPLAALLLLSFAGTALAQYSAFTYQGRLTDGGNPANGSYELQFTLYDSGTNGNVLGGPLTSTVAASNGLFTTTLDFGLSAMQAGHPGSGAWLAIAARPAGNTNAFTLLTPRQPLTAVPYATIADGILSTATIQAQALNVGSGCSLGGQLATIAGGFGNSITNTGFSADTIGGGQLNSILAAGSGAAVGGGQSNVASGYVAAVAGGDQNSALGNHAFIGGGTSNTAAGDYSVVCGGQGNDPGPHSFIGGGDLNAANGAYDFVGGGYGNSAGGGWNCIGSGDGNAIIGDSSGCFIGSGIDNSIQDESQQSTIGGGNGNRIQSLGTQDTIGGGVQNMVNGGQCTIGGGEANTINDIPYGAVFATIGGGWSNTASSWATIAGGVQNKAASCGTVGGGFLNIAAGVYSFAVGCSNWAAGACSTVAGGYGNTAGAWGSATGGGHFNVCDGYDAAISGGLSNYIALSWSAIGGGVSNRITGSCSTIGGGSQNTAADYGTVPGGWGNQANGICSFAAGYQAKASDGSFVWADYTLGQTFQDDYNNQFKVRANGGALFQGGGGFNNTQLKISQTTSTDFCRMRFDVASVPRAWWDIALGPDSSLHFYNGMAGADRIVVLGNGNVGIGTTSPGHLLVVGSLASPAYCDGTTWQNGSDRDLKEDFAVINPRAVLEKVSALPITEWRYKVGSDGTRHLGPMAQDFHAAFGLNGGDDKHIATVDESGVALAAIQGLNQKLEEQLRAQDAELRSLKDRLTALEERMNSNGNK